MFRDYVTKFDLLRNAPQDDPEAFYRWACDQHHESTRLAARFVLTRWDPRFIERADAAQRHHERLGAFDVFEAKMRWDGDNIAALVAWLTA